MTIGTSSVPTTCLCCVAAALLTKSSATAAESSSRAMAEQSSFLSVYTPLTNVDDIAALDLGKFYILGLLGFELYCVYDVFLFLY